MKYFLSGVGAFPAHNAFVWVLGCSLLLVVGNMHAVWCQELEMADPAAEAAPVAADHPEVAEMPAILATKDPQSTNLLGQQIKKDPKFQFRTFRRLSRERCEVG